MAFALTDSESQQLSYVPVDDLVDLATELDMAPPADVDRLGLLTDCIPRLLEHGRRDGLPFSKYDADDLQELPQDHRQALASALGWDADVRSMLKAGAKVYKNTPARSQVALLLPSLLKPLARYAFESR